ncbi:MAG: hypothetical protein P8J42_08140 [Pseudomonadales bacterium]|nr:hypothetical protein [Pseudomonadales bacterium]
MIQHANNRQVCFAQQQDFVVYTDCLDDCASEFGVEVKANVLIVDGEDDPLIPAGHAHSPANKGYRAKPVINDRAVHNDIHEHKSYTAAVSSALA